MLKNYLVITLRSFKKNLAYTLINILGLAIGLSGVIITFLLFQYEANFDSLQKNTGQIYRINTNRFSEKEEQKWGITPLPLGIEASEQISGVNGYCRYARGRLLFKHEDKIHEEIIFFADSVFFDWFSFVAIKGNTISFKEKNTVIIDENTARKYFADEDPIGKSFTLFFENNKVADVQVGAVLKNVPKNSSFQFGIILPFDNLYEIYGIKKTDWNIDLPTITYINLHSSTTKEVVQDQLSSYVQKNNEILTDWKINGFYLSSFKKQKDESSQLNLALTWPGLPLSALYGSLFMNSILLLISCFNFMNTAIAYSRNRLKEIGIRKTFGGLKNQIVFQFMLENFIQTIIAFFISIDIANKWINWMNVQWPIKIEANYFANPWLILFLFGLLLIVTIASGAYPAFYITRFKPSDIFKGDLHLKGTRPFTRILLTWQYTFSITAVFSGIVLILNANYQNKLDWGYDKEHVIVVPLHVAGNFEPLKNSLSQINEISNIAGSINNVGYNYNITTFEMEGVEHQSPIIKIGDNYLETLGITINQGRDFKSYSENDMNESIIVNQKFVDIYEIEKPLKTSIILNEKRYYIVGVINNFMPYGLHEPIKPVIISKIKDSACTLLSINVASNDLKPIYNQLEKTWKELYPNLPFDGYYQSNSYQAATYINEGVLKQFAILALFGLLLSISGLYSMVSLNVNKRIKEIGIRKVLGASAIHIINLMNREFIIILAIASILGTALGYLFIDLFLDNIYDYYISIGPGIFLLSIFIIVITAILTSGGKILSAAKMNPTNSLKYE